MNWNSNTLPGYRLKRLEVTNWGTFDSAKGQVHSLQLDGRNGLLVGQNGSGKSTLVDAILTLLVQPGVRNYNVAAGAKKRERDERTYIRGACGRSSDQELGSVTDYLRPSDKHYSALLACFEHQTTGSAFTVVQVLQITSDGEVDKTYGFADCEKSIAADLSGLSRSEKLRKQLQSRGFQATTKYSEYAPWIAKKTGMRAKAMDVFNQTVAVKDIQSLNRFIRDHMLEGKPWRERIESLLTHFEQLSLAHQSLIKARRQVDLLKPIEAAADSLRKLQAERSVVEQQIDAIESFVREQAIGWLEPRIAENSASRGRSSRRKDQLQREIEALDESQRTLKNEIEQHGGERLRQIPHMIDARQAKLDATRRERQRWVSALKGAGLQGTFSTREEFESIPQLGRKLQRELAEQATGIAEARLEAAHDLTRVRRLLEDEQSQLEHMHKQAGNLPSWLAEVRAKIADSIGVDWSELSFAGELISVRDDQSDWQPAIETLLRRFGLTLLVPEEHYRAVSRYIDEHRIVDSRGHGQRLVYIRVSDRPVQDKQERLHPDSLVRKLELRSDHALHGWLQAELTRRFDYRCCETLDEFQRASSMAVTKSRHVKYGSQQHEKDDRSHSSDPRQFILGWDSAQRRMALMQSVSELKHQERIVTERIADLEAQTRELSKRSSAIDVALAISEFESIDTDQHQSAIEALEKERDAIEASNDSVRLLRERLEEVIARRFAVQRERDEQIAAESNLSRENEAAMEYIERSRGVLAGREADGTLAEHRLSYPVLLQSMQKALETVKRLSDFAEVQRDASQNLQNQLRKIFERTEPLRSEAVRTMQRFLSENPEQREDLRADVQYIDGFLALLEKLRDEDLPRHEQRFRERLNEKVLQELGVFHAALQCESQEILTKIATLNSSLEQLEYRAGTFMKLEPRVVQDREIREFQTMIRDCLDDAFDGNHEADEGRYLRIEKLIKMFRDEERWREKVTDVRRWYDFAARELDAVSGEERSCYEDGSGQSGGEKAKLAFTILVAAIAYQFDIDPLLDDDEKFRFVVVDEMFSKVDDRYADYALQLFEKFGLQLLIVAPLDAKARVTEPYVGRYLHTVKNEKSRTSSVISLSAVDYEQAVGAKRKVVNSTGELVAPGKPR